MSPPPPAATRHRLHPEGRARTVTSRPDPFAGQACWFGRSLLSGHSGPASRSPPLPQASGGSGQG
jgi:hypothetical protein